MTESVANKTAHPEHRNRLSDRVKLETLQELQDHFALLGRMTACITTVEGELLTRPTWGSRFSELVATSPHGASTFSQQIRLLVENASAKAHPVIHDGMELYATRITSNGTSLGVLVIGIRLHTAPDEERTTRMIADYSLDADETQQAVKDFNPARGGTPADIRRFADVLSQMIASMYEQAVNIEDQLRNLHTVHDLSQLLGGTLDLKDILEKTVRRVTDVMRVKACAIRLLNRDTGELVIEAVHNLSAEYLNKGAVLISENAIDAAACAGEVVYIADAQNDPRIRFPQNAKCEGIVSGLCAPLGYRGQTIGVIRVYASEKREFTESETALLRSIGSQAAAAIIHRRLHEEQASSEQAKRQLETASQVQRRMLPASAPSLDGVELGYVYDPSLQLSGDFFDFIDLPTGDVGICIADVVGKGVPAALLMTAIRSTLRAFAPTSDDVTRIVSQVNHHLCRDSRHSEFATLFYGILNVVNRTLTFCDAGHPPPVLLRGDEFTDLEAGGMAIGILLGESYESNTVQLQSGDTIAMVTDGVTEAMNFEGEEFGRERLLRAVWKYRNTDAQHLASQILWDVRRFAGLAEQSDDITIVTIKVE
jgi:phosphoserine phosphatase RsbU/P